MQVPQDPTHPPSPICHRSAPIRHPEQPRNDLIPPMNTSQGSRGNRAVSQHQGNNVPEHPRSNQQNKIVANPAQPRQHNMHPPRMGSNGQRPLPRRNQRANSYKEASVRHSQSASSNSGLRDRNVPREPDLMEQLNQDRGFEAY